MDVSRNDMLGELAGDAALERTDFLVEATEQLTKFLERHRDRIAALGGLTLLDDDLDYLAVAPDLTFRVRTRDEDPSTGAWSADTEIIETASELIELYNPAVLYQAFAEAAREAAGLGGEPTATDALLDSAGIAPDETVRPDGSVYASAADEWAASQPEVGDATDETSAARSLYDLALDFQERSQAAEARLLEQFEEVAEGLVRRLGDVMIHEDDDERLVLLGSGRFTADVLTDEETQSWEKLDAPDALVEYYDPTDVFGDLADALAEAFPGIAPADEDEDEDDEGAAGR